MECEVVLEDVGCEVVLVLLEDVGCEAVLENVGCEVVLEDAFGDDSGELCASFSCPSNLGAESFSEVPFSVGNFAVCNNRKHHISVYIENQSFK